MDRILGLDAPWLVDLAWQLINTIILAGLLSFILYKPVLEFMRKRTERINSQIATAATELEAALAMKAEYEQKLKDIDKERAGLMEEARKRAQERENQLVNEAKAQAEVIKNRAALDIERERQKALEDMKVQMVEISSVMASRFVKGKMDAETGARLLDEAIKDLGDAKWVS